MVAVIEGVFHPIPFNKVCDEQKIKKVEVLLELGADPFSEDQQGVAAVTKAALSNIEPRFKLRSLQSSKITKVKLL